MTRPKGLKNYKPCLCTHKRMFHDRISGKCHVCECQEYVPDVKDSQGVNPDVEVAKIVGG